MRGLQLGLCVALVIGCDKGKPILSQRMVREFGDATYDAYVITAHRDGKPSEK
jgi:hypothetical protein